MNAIGTELASRGAEHGLTGLILVAAGLGAAAWFYFVHLPDAAASREQRKEDHDLQVKRTTAEIENGVRLTETLGKLSEVVEQTHAAVIGTRGDVGLLHDAGAKTVSVLRSLTEAFKRVDDATGGRLKISEHVGAARAVLHELGDETGPHRVPPEPGSARHQRTQT